MIENVNATQELIETDALSTQMAEANLHPEASEENKEEEDQVVLVQENEDINP